MSSLWNRHMLAFLEISSITVLCYLLFRCYRKSVTLTVFFLCTILSSFLAMRSTSWSFTMFKGSRLFDGAYARASIYVWKCARLCVSFSGSMRGIHCLSLGSPLLWSRACGKCSFTGRRGIEPRAHRSVCSLWKAKSLRSSQAPLRLRATCSDYRLVSDSGFIVICMIYIHIKGENIVKHHGVQYMKLELVKWEQD